MFWPLSHTLSPYLIEWCFSPMGIIEQVHVIGCSSKGWTCFFCCWVHPGSEVIQCLQAGLSQRLYAESRIFPVSCMKGRCMSKCGPSHCRWTQLWIATHISHPAAGSQRVVGIVWLLDWLAPSVCPSSGWSVVEAVTLIPRSWLRLWLKFDTNWVPLLLITSSGRQWSLQMWSLNNQATPEAIMSNVIYMAWAHLDRRSTTTIIASYPWLCVIRSTEMTFQWQLGTWFDMSFPISGAGKVLVWLQKSQPFMHSAT